MALLINPTTAHTHGRHPHKKWWKSAAVYQIYPSSFADANGDGIGDLPGIISKLDYLHKLNVDVVWLSPIYRSPQKDMGYDISDYCDVDPRYGEMKDVDALLDGLHARGMRLVLDLVVNHSSDEHPWFQESKKNLTNPKADWYIWRPPRYISGVRCAPNNWESVFGGPAWTYVPARDQYYLHLFLPGQPDLNWEVPAVREAVYDVMRFWLDKGVDGFRMDVINLISKVQTFPDAPGNGLQSGMDYCANGPRMHEFLREMRRQAVERYDVLTVGEMPWVKDEWEVLKAVGRERGELDMVFQFDIVSVDWGSGNKFEYRQFHPKLLADVVNRWQTFMIEHDGWNTLFDENHDQPRTVSRFVDRKYTDSDYDIRAKVSKMLATFLVCQSGTVYVYQGQELGMRNCPKEWPIEEYKDIETTNYWNKVLEERGGGDADMSDVMAQVQLKARDNGRTPMQWNDTAHGGFTTGTPWMRVNDDYPCWNAALQTGDPDSAYSYWSRLLRFRKEFCDIVVYGDFEMLTGGEGGVIAYRRKGYMGAEVGSGKAAAIVVVLNFEPGNVGWRLEEGRFPKKVVPDVLLGTYGTTLFVEQGILVLRPFEAVVLDASV
ncbi:glycoside hydrolase superfamily [Morchella snyderi]|nr:glycoside hydrolase superfamily [Morchella snyderi]